MSPSIAIAETREIVERSARLVDALRVVMGSTPAAGLGPIEAARILGVDKTLTSRLMTALRATDSMAALNSLPGTAPLRQLLRAARSKGADRVALQAADEELAAFDRSLQRTFGTRTHLDAVIADALPEARRRHQESARQVVYRGMALVKGVSIDLASITWVFHPSRERPDRVDMLVLAAFSGIRRLRPTASVRFISSYQSGQPELGAGLVREFCRPSDLSISAIRQASTTTYEISTGPIRRDATSDIALCEYLTAAHPAKCPIAGPKSFSCGDAVAHAYKRLALTMLVHRDAWVGCDFELRAYDTATRGLVALPDPARELDRLDIDESLLRTADGREALRRSPVRSHLDMVTAVTSPHAWDLGEFRGFHGEVVYPLYGAHIMLLHEAGNSVGADHPPNG